MWAGRPHYVLPATVVRRHRGVRPRGSVVMEVSCWQLSGEDKVDRRGGGGGGCLCSSTVWATWC